MICALPPHRDGLTFADYDAYEVHYAQEHLNRCLECGRNFPTAHFLALHIAENHDPLNEARKARGEKIVRLALFFYFMFLFRVWDYDLRDSSTGNFFLGTIVFLLGLGLVVADNGWVWDLLVCLLRRAL